LDVSEVCSVLIFSYMLMILTIEGILCHRSLLPVNDRERKANFRKATYILSRQNAKPKEYFLIICISNKGTSSECGGQS
jgi:hypothetical protein